MYLLVILTRSIVSLIVFATSEKSEKNEANNSELIFIHFIYSIIKEEEEEEEVSSTISSTKIGRDESCSIVVASSSTYTYPDEPRFDEVGIEEKKVEDDYSDFR